MKSFEKLKLKLKVKRQNRFLAGFKCPDLRKVIYFYELENECMDLRKRQCLHKVIRNHLSTQEIWDVIKKKGSYNSATALLRNLDKTF